MCQLDRQRYSKKDARSTSCNEPHVVASLREAHSKNHHYMKQPTFSSSPLGERRLLRTALIRDRLKGLLGSHEPFVLLLIGSEDLIELRLFLFHRIVESFGFRCDDCKFLFVLFDIFV